MPAERLPTSRTLLSILLVGLACAALGAFGTCDAALVPSETANDKSGLFILAGAAGGLILGLLIALWDRQWARQPAPALRRFLIRFSYATAWLLTGVFSFLLAGRINSMHNWIPVRIPIRFDRVNTAQATFTADMTETYHVMLDLERKIPNEDLNAFTDSWIIPGEPRHVSPPRPTVVWTVTNVKAGDQQTFWRGDSWGETVGLKIGEFKAVAGQRYTVTAKVIKPSPTLQVLNPHLQIELTYIVWPEYYVPAMIATYASLIAAVIGLSLLVYACRKWSEDRRKLPQNANVADSNVVR